MVLSLSKGKWHIQNHTAPKMAEPGFKPRFLRLLSYIINFFPPRPLIETWCVAGCGCVCVCVPSYMSLISLEESIASAREWNVFLIILKYHEKIQGEAVARPRCCLWSMEDKKIIPAGARSSASGVSFGTRGWGLFCASVWGSGGHISNVSDVCILKLGWKDPEETSVWLCPINHNLPPKSKREKGGEAEECIKLTSLKA